MVAKRLSCASSASVRGKMGFPRFTLRCIHCSQCGRQGGGAQLPMAVLALLCLGLSGRAAAIGGAVATEAIGDLEANGSRIAGGALRVCSELPAASECYAGRHADGGPSGLRGRAQTGNAPDRGAREELAGDHLARAATGATTSDYRIFPCHHAADNSNPLLSLREIRGKSGLDPDQNRYSNPLSLPRKSSVTAWMSESLAITRGVSTTISSVRSASRFRSPNRGPIRGSP